MCPPMRRLLSLLLWFAVGWMVARSNAEASPVRAPTPATGLQSTMNNGQRRKWLVGVPVFLLLSLATGWYGISLTTVDRTLPRPPAASGGLVLLVDPQGAGPHSRPHTVSVTVDDRLSAHPVATAQIDTLDWHGLVILSGSLRPYDLQVDVSRPCGEPSCIRRVEELRLRDALSNYQIDAAENLETGGRWAVLPGYTSTGGALGVEVPSGKTVITWRLAAPVAVQGRGNESGGLPAIGTPSLKSFLEPQLRTLNLGEYDADLGDSPRPPPAPNDPVEAAQELLRQRVINTEREGESQELIHADVNQASLDASMADDPTNLQGDWAVPQDLDTALVVRGLQPGQQVDQASPEPASLRPLAWISAPGAGQVAATSWETSDPPSQQQSSDRLLYAGLALGAAVGGLTTLLGWWFLERE